MGLRVCTLHGFGYGLGFQYPREYPCSCLATGNGEEEHVEGDDIDPSVEDSDAALVDEGAAEAGGDLDVPPLSRDKVNLGKFAVTKVSVFCHNS